MWCWTYIVLVLFYKYECFYSRYLIESLQRSYLISKKVPKTIDNYTKETTPFNQIFGGYMRQDVTCLRCKHVSTTLQHFMDLSLDIRHADHIDTALAGYFRRENLGQGENLYNCEMCHQKVPATKQYKIERPPLVLCVQLQRFNMMGGKNDTLYDMHFIWKASILNL